MLDFGNALNGLTDRSQAAAARWADCPLNSPAVFDVVYMAGYFGFVLLAPIFALAAGLLFAFERLASRRGDKGAT
jgi:hypothetical protein